MLDTDYKGHHKLNSMEKSVHEHIYFHFQNLYDVFAQIKNQNHICLSSFNAPNVPDLVLYCLIYVP